MSTGGLSGELYRPLTPDQVKKIHERALDLIEEVGMTYEVGLKDVLDHMSSIGCRIDHDASRIFFPRELVTKMVAKAPEEFIMYSRDGKNDMHMGGNRVYAGTGGTSIKILDLEDGKPRQTLLMDAHNVARIMDKMNNIHFFQSCAVPHDIPPEHYDYNIIFAAMLGTNKHVMLGCNFDSTLRDSFRMVSKIVGGEDILRKKPVFSISSCMLISPLKFCTQSTQNALTAAELGVPTTATSAPMSGSTAPMTMAGTLLQTHAEELAAITLVQAHHPGAKMLYGGLPAMADMRSMGYQGGGVECGMMTAAIHQLSQHIKVPNYCSSGLSDAKVPDAQAGWEKAFTTGLAVMSGNNYIHHAAGMLESMLCLAYEQYIMDDEIIGQAMKILEGITVDEAHMAYDAIKDVGPGGNYLVSPHTMKYIRNEYFQGNGISDKSSRHTWTQAGELDTRSRARQMARSILEEPFDAKIPREIQEEIRQELPIHI